MCASSREGQHAEKERKGGREGGREVQPVSIEVWSGVKEKVLKAGWERTSRLGTSLYRR